MSEQEQTNKQTNENEDYRHRHSDITQRDYYRRKAFEASNGHCQECGDELTSDFIIHHIDALHLKILCKKCHSNIHGHKEAKKERRIYVPYYWEPIFERLEAILKREGSNFSRWIRQQVDLYVRLHEPGNPQQLLTKVILEGKPYQAEECFICHQPALHKIRHGNITRFVCPFHRQQALDSKKWVDEA